MSITTESSSPTNKSTRINMVGQIGDITNMDDSNNNNTLIIVLAVTLPTLAFIAILASVIIYYRRRYTTIWLKKLENSSRLQAIVVNLSPTPIQSQYFEKKLTLSYPQYQQPSTKTVIYNRLSAPSTPIVNSPFKLPIKGETNPAFDEHSFKNKEQPILRSLSTIEQPTTILQTDFPVSLQAPVPIITSTFVKAIAKHHRTILPDTNNKSLETSGPINTNNTCQDSGTLPPESDPSKKVLLFSQRTEF